MFNDKDRRNKDRQNIDGNNIDRNHPGETIPDVRRRTFLTTSVAALAGLGLWQWRKLRAVEVVSAASGPKEITVVLFSDAGERQKKVTIAKVVKTDAEWRKQLDSNAFDITRRADTEIAFTGKYWNLHDKGIYRCICCDNALFDSATKFESGTGWPSFWAPIAKENVREITDMSLGMSRTAVSCTECDAHLGHVFTDGPQPTGLRYCMNSASLRFVKQGLISVL
jgi:peptide-methionine (R)-S-oxide reductase